MKAKATKGVSPRPLPKPVEESKLGDDTWTKPKPKPAKARTTVSSDLSKSKQVKGSNVQALGVEAFIKDINAAVTRARHPAVALLAPLESTQREANSKKGISTSTNIIGVGVTTS